MALTAPNFQGDRTVTYFNPSLQLVEQLVRREIPVCAYIHDLDGLARHAREIVSNLPAQSEFFYAIKANSDPAVLVTLAPIVAGFEVASAGEIRKVRQAVGPQARIIMGGPARTETDFIAAIDHGVERVHIESLHLLHLANMVAARAGTKLPILLRINMAGPVPGATITMGGQPTQFGIEEARVDEAIQLAKSRQNLRFDGFHLHTISNNLDADAHAVFCREALLRAQDWAKRNGLEARVINLGGGWGVDYADLDRRFDIHHLAEGLADAIPADGTVLQFECGRIVVAYCAVYVTEVIDLKTTHGETFALLRGGSHHFRLPSAWQHRHPHKILKGRHWPRSWSRPTIGKAVVTFTGELCTPKDVLLRDEEVHDLGVGDIVCFLAAGAYGWDISHHDFLSNAHPERIFLNQTVSNERLIA
ncbi:type III PLP-dependent enzyme [Agrobacterium deltaense]|nr:type III PLP-dependent enzyme [Agrobacterium deltaense]